jgi:hypothetical protein
VVRFLPFLISLALSIYALFSCIQTRDKDVPYLPKLVWILIIVFIPFVGPIVWLLLARGQGVPLRAASATRSNRPAGRPVAPDDDPDFLASLERYRDPRTTVRPPKPRDPKATRPADDQATEPEADKPKTDPAPDRPQDKSDQPEDRPAKAGHDEPESDNASDSPSDTDGDR